MNTYSTIRAAFIFLMLCFLAAPPARATESQTLNAGWLLETAKSTILTNSPWSDAGCNVEIESSPPDFILYRSGQIEVVGTLNHTPNNLRDLGAVDVEVYINGELYMVFDPSPYLSVTLTTFAAAHDIDRDQVLTEADVDQIETDINTLPSSDIYESLDEIIGMAARMNIQVGRIFSDGMLALPILVERGEELTVYIPLGPASIALHGIALDSGSLGDEIRVKNPDSNTIITAEVTGPSTATIRLLN
ncbi:MAG: flagellar basal body P-ring formation chaperone FlgA [bacterium]|nr:flagellar basal body P-ring formation chaperone FlgA [bacterium]